MSDVKYPEAHVDLIGEDGNALSIIGRTARALRRAGVSSEGIAEYQTEAMSGDYDHVLQTTMAYVETD